MGNEIGSAGEKVVAQYLTENGYSIIVQNYRKRYGEIDIIAKKNDKIHFIEVKTMLHEPWENISYLINAKKKRKIAQTAKQFLVENRQYSSMDMQFDVAILKSHPLLKLKPEIMYFENAFGEI